MIIQVDTENGDYDLTSAVTVLTDTPNASNPTICQALLLAGDGAKNLDGSGGNFNVTVTIAGVTIEPDPDVKAVSSGATRAALMSNKFLVPANGEVIIKLKSPNGADTDVDVTAYLYDISKVDLGAINESQDAAKSQEIAAAIRGNKATQTKATGAIAVRNFDDDADLYNVTLTDGDTTIVRAIAEA